MSSPVDLSDLELHFRLNREHMMELWGSGFNAHGQLRSVDKYTESGISPETDDIPPNERLNARTDIFEFRRIAEGDNVKVLYAGWCQTVRKC